MANATAVAEFLESRPEVESVSFPALESSKWHDRGRVMAGACREPELLSCFGEAEG